MQLTVFVYKKAFSFIQRSKSVTSTTIIIYLIFFYSRYLLSLSKEDFPGNVTLADHTYCEEWKKEKGDG